MLRDSVCRFLLSILALAATALTIPSLARGQGCPGGNQSNGPDVIVGDITGPSNYSVNGSLEALSLGTTSCNLGNVQLKWDACPANTHPVIGGNLFKWSTVSGATRFEQVGQSWLKHGFTALQGTNCCPNCQSSGTGTRLGIGCSDPYTSDRNGQQSGLGPKYTVNAHTGVYPASCPNHPSGNNNGRIEVDVSDLTATSATTRFFGQSQYVTPDDATFHNQNNNASYREITVSVGGTAWTFGFSGSTVRQIPAIRHWKEIDSGVVETDVNTPEDDGFPGLVIMAAKATNLGGGVYRYEYAVNNLNSDRSIQSFSVPVSATATVTNIGFHDVTYRYGDGRNASGTGGTSYSATDWPGSFSGGAVTWSTQTYAVNQGANAIRWGVLFNFRFDANIAPTTGNVTLVQFNPGAQTILASTVIPTAVVCNPPVMDPISGASATCGVSFTSSSPSLSSGTSPVTWSLDPGTPAGMTINPGTGVVSWPTPVTTGSPYTITTKATNSCGNSTQSWALTVSANSPTVDTISSETTLCGIAYTSAAPTASGGATPLTWSLVSGPAGMTINPSTGTVSWPSPDGTGSPYTITVRADSANGCGSDSKSWGLKVNDNPPSINSIANAFAVCGAAYTSAAPTTTGGAAPLSWALLAGPAGMTIDASTGAVSWPSPVATGSPFTITAQATSVNNCGTSAPQSWQLGVVIGDFDADGLVTESDLPGFVDDLLADVPNCAGDLNGDGFVDGIDIPSFDAALGL